MPSPDSMAYVGGGFDSTLEALVRKARYTTARCLRRIVPLEGRRFEFPMVRIAVHADVVDVLTGALVPGLPTFVARMHGVSDPLNLSQGC